MRSTLLWTGGKDSSLAFYKAQLAGYEVVSLLTFVRGGADFLAHPVSFMKYQAKAMGLPHYEIAINPPFEDTYEKAIRFIRKKHKIDVLITGDIAEIDGHPNWIRERSMNFDINVVTPLWGANRYQLLTEFLSYGFRAIISCIKRGCLTEEWLGRELDGEALDKLREISGKTGLDICGERGEYHTLVLDGPLFKKSVIIGNYSRDANDSVAYIKPYNVTLRSGL